MCVVLSVDVSLLSKGVVPLVAVALRLSEVEDADVEWSSVGLLASLCMCVFRPGSFFLKELKG